MSTINIDIESFNAKLDVIAKGFNQNSPKEYEEIASDLPSIISMLDILKDINSALGTYQAFLATDVEKFRQMGKTIENMDQELAKATGG